MNWIEPMLPFHFLRPVWLIALPPLWALAAWAMFKQTRDGNWTRVVEPHLLPSLRLKGLAGSSSSSLWPWLLCAWTLTVAALAGPSWERESIPAYRAPASWMVVLGLTPTMAGTDLAPNRYTRARYAIDDLLDGAHDARVGMVVYSDEAYTLAPLTDDVATIKGLLPPLAPDIMPSAGKQLAPALERAGTLLQSSASKEKQLILFADQFDDPAAALQVAAKLKAQGVTVNVVGVGTPEGAPIRDADGRFTLDAAGRAKFSRLDVDSLRQVATVGGGSYYTLNQIGNLAEGMRTQTNRLSGAAREDHVQIATWLDGGAWLLPALLILAALLARRGWL